MADRLVIDGPAGTTYTNDTDRVLYQFICTLHNTCGVCLQYHMKISYAWPIPVHWNCRCIQRPVPPGGEAPHKFVDYRDLLDGMSKEEQRAAIGASNYALLKSGTVKWEDIVSPNRVRDFREVVDNKQLSVKTMTAAGVSPYYANQAKAAISTPGHQAAAAAQQAIMARLTSAGISQENVIKELSKGLAGRVTIGPGPTGPYSTGPAWGGGPLPGTGLSSAGELAKLITGWRPPQPPPPPAPTAPPPPPPPPPAPAAPVALDPATAREDYLEAIRQLRAMEEHKPRNEAEALALGAARRRVDEAKDAMRKATLAAAATEAEAIKAAIPPPPAPVAKPRWGKMTPAPLPPKEVIPPPPVAVAPVAATTAGAADPALPQGTTRSEIQMNQMRLSRDDQLARIASSTGLDPAYLRTIVDNKLQAVVDESHFYARVDYSTLPKILESRFKSQFETNKSNGMLSSSRRKSVEESVIGLPTKTKPEDRPIYGYVSAKDFGSYQTPHESHTKQYGDVAVRFKDSIRDRSTVTFGDSLNAQGSLAATPARAVKVESVSYSVPSGFASKPVDEFRTSLQFDKMYIEAQMHGKVNVSDIAEIAFPSQPDANMIELLKQKGIPWQVKTK